MQLKAYIQAAGRRERRERRVDHPERRRRPCARRRRTAPRVFAAKAGALSGTANLVAASAGRRASYEWEYSTDGGKTWVFAPPTLQAKTTVSGLTPGATVQFRYRPVTKTGEADWSAPVPLIVK